MLTIKVSDELAAKLQCKTAEELTAKLTGLATPPPADPPQPAVVSPDAPAAAAPVAHAAVVAAPEPVAAKPEVDVTALTKRIEDLEAKIKTIKPEAEQAAAAVVAEATAAVGGPAVAATSTATEPVETIDSLRAAANKETDPIKKGAIGKKLFALRFPSKK